MTKPTVITTLSIRIGDINYGGHLAHDRLVTLLHQARLDFLSAFGGNENNLHGVGLIMRQLIVDYRNEAFLNDNLIITTTLGEQRLSQFILHYNVNCDKKLIATAQTTMVAFDYAKRKVVALPAAFLDALVT